MTPVKPDAPDTGSRSWNNAHTGKDVTASAEHEACVLPVDHCFAQTDRTTHETTPLVTDENDYWDSLTDTLSVAQLAQILSISKITVAARLRAGDIPGYFIVGSWIVFKEEVRAWLDSKSNQVAPGPAAPVDVLIRYGNELTYRDLMKLFGKSKPTIYAWLNNGHIPAFHLGTSWVIHKPQLRQMLNATKNQQQAAE